MQRTIELPDKIQFTSGDTTFDVETMEIADASLVRIIMYGRRMFNDSVNGTIHAEKDKPTDDKRSRKAIAQTWIDAMVKGTLGNGRGGHSRVSAIEKELRICVQGLLVNECGYKSGEATKMVSKGAQATFTNVVAKELSASEDQAANAWKKLATHAETVIAQRKDAPDLSEMLS